MRRSTLTRSIDSVCLLLVTRLSIAFLVACSASHGGSNVDAPVQVVADTATDTALGSDAAQPACAGRMAQPLDATWSLTVNSVARSALVHVPASYDPTQPTPVVINIHGLAGDPAGEASVTHMIAKSDAEGFIAVHPQGTGVPLSWNAGYCCNPASASGIDDTAFFSALVDQLEAQLCVDQSRIFAAGMSNGGFMSYRLGCELADRIAAIGPVAGVLGISGCQPARPIPVFHVHGTADPLVPYDGGNGQLSVADTIAFFVQNNGCTTSTQTYQNGDATCVTHGGCTQGADVVLCTIQDGGHQWPGGDPLPLLGKDSMDLITTDALWTFFQAHPKQ